MSSFIILQAAMANAKKEREARERKEKEMIANGYTREFVQTNEMFCYVHIYRNLAKQKSGLMWCIISMFLMLVCTNIAILTSHYSALFFLAIFMITFFIGIKKYYNKERVSNDSKEPAAINGCVCLYTLYEPTFDWRWVKKGKRK